MTEFLLWFSEWQWLATAAAFLLFAGIEYRLPFRAAGQGRLNRWIANLGLYAFGLAAVVLLVPLMTAAGGWLQASLGLRPLVQLGLPVWLLVLVSFVLIDLVAYLTHALFHGVPWLWRLHGVHHSDGVLDASTGIRHHPFEAIAAAFVQLMVIAVLGLPLLVLLAYGVVAMLWQFFSHANISLPQRLDRAVRLVLVTPSMHRVHHSVLMSEGNSNFGMVLSIWDRLFGTYRRRPAAEQQVMLLGLNSPQSKPGLLGLLFLPFKP